MHSTRLTISVRKIVYLTVAVIFLKLTYERVYLCVYKSYSYYGFQYSFDLNRYILSWLMTFVLVPLNLRNLDRICFSKTIPLVLYFVAYIPATVLYIFMDETPFIFMYIVYFLCFYIYNEIVPTFKMSFKHKILLSDRTIRTIALLAVCIIVYIWGRYAGFRINLSLQNVYDYRAEAKNYSIPTLFRYIHSGMRTAVLPMLSIWCFSKKQIFNCMLFSFAEIISFFIDGSKSILFSLLLAFGLYLYIHKKTERIKFVPIWVGALSLIGDVLYRICNNTFIVNVVIRRIIFEPALINYFYYDYFSTHHPDYFMQSFMRYFGFHSDYNMSLAHIIGLNYYGSAENGANNGLFSDAYMNLGVIGIFIMPLLIVLLLRLLDNFSRRLDISVIVAPIITTSLSLLSSSFFTSLLTHGLLLLMVFFALLSAGSGDLNNVSISNLNDNETL